MIKKNTHAFTLIELLVASALMVALVSIVLYLTSGVLTSWNTATGKLGTNFDARLSLDLLAQDLEGALFRNDGKVWLLSETVDEDLPPSGSTVWLRFFTAAPDRDRVTEKDEPIYGDITAVSYRLLYTNPIKPSGTTGRVAGLYRTVIDSTTTFSDFLGQLESKTGPQFMDEKDPNSLSQSFLAGNIVSFQTAFFVDANRDGIIANDEELIPLDSLAPVSSTLRPDAADITLTILTDEGATLYEAANTGIDTGLSHEEILAKFGEVFSRRVHFLSNPL